VIVLRLYPLPLRAVARVLRRRRGSVGFLGSLRALRDPMVGMVPVLAVLAGVAVAGLSATTLATLDAGTERAALTETGAAMRVTGGPASGVTDAQYEQITRIPGVAAASRFARIDAVPVTVPGRATKPTAEVLLADLPSLAVAQQGVPGAVPALGLSGGDEAPMAIGAADLASPGTIVIAGTHPVTVAAVTDRLTGLTRATTFLLLDARVTAFGPFQPTTVLVSLAPRADPAAVGAAITGVLGPGTTVSVAAATAAELKNGAMVGGIRAALYGALVAAAAVTIAALLLTVVAGARSRMRLMAVVRILGLTRRQRSALLLWEQAPGAVAALIAGAGLGVALTALVHAAIDLVPFTGGRTQPPLVVDGPALAMLLSGFVAVVAAALALGIPVAHRTTAATAIAIDEE